MNKRTGIVSLAVFVVAFFLNFLTPPLASARQQPLVLAFYYAWFDQNIWDLKKVADLPTLRYLSNDPSTVARQIKMAQDAGIDVFVVSWWGAGNPTDVNFRSMLDVSAALNFKTAADFEITSPFYSNRDDVVNSLKNLLATHVNHPGYLRVDGKPVIFFWSNKAYDFTLRYSVDDWKAIRDQVDPNRQTIWIAEGIDWTYLRVFDGLHLYSIAWAPNVFAEDAKWPRRVKSFGSDKIWVATVMPGNDDRKTQRPGSYVRDRENGEFYRQTWRAAFATNPDWIIITSWNEWVEGTMIEPSVTYGNLYLDITRQFAAQFKKGLPTPTATLSPTPKPTATFTVPPPTRTPAPTFTIPLPNATPETNSGSSSNLQVSLNTSPNSVLNPSGSGVRAKTTDALRVRAEPSTTAAVLGRLRQGEDILLLARTGDGKWFQTQLPNSTDLGWIAAEFLSINDSTDTLLVSPGSTLVASVATETPIPDTPVPAPTEASATPTPAPTFTPTPQSGFKLPLHLPFFP